MSIFGENIVNTARHENSGETQGNRRTAGMGGKPGTKRATRGEYLTAKDFIAAFDTVREWDDIHTGNVKPYIKRQQTPFIALLHCAGILE